MKKQIIAAAVAAAVSVPALAQVTIGGRLDLSYTSLTNVGTAAAGSDTTRFVSPGVLYTNFFSISGSEDLGGGLKASFVMATNINDESNDGASGASTSFGDRGLQLTLSGGFGAISIGKADTSDINTIHSGPTNLTNLIISGGDPQTNPRPSNRIQYTSPVVNGFTGRFAYATNANDTSATAVAPAAVTGAEGVTSATKNQGQYKSIGLSYASGPVSAVIARATIDDVANNDVATDEGFRVSYNAGVATFHAAYLKSDNRLNTTDLTATSFDVTVPLGNGLTLMLGTVQNEDEATNTNSSDRYSAVLAKDLSKRTQIYGAYAMSSNGTTGASNAIGTLGPVGAGRDQTGYSFGVRHSF